MKILGIGGQGYRDSSVAVVVDGRVAAAASEGRFTRTKHQGGFPHQALEYCLESSGLTLDDIDHVALANNPWLNLRNRLIEWYGERFLETPRFKTFHIFHDELHAAVSYLAELEQLRRGPADRVRIQRHHLCHLAEAYYLSPFDEAAILGVDGRGELSTSSRGMGRGGRIEVFAVEEMPNSIGLLCAAVADFLGFRDEDDEFRIMSISSLGEPRYLEVFRRILRPAEGGGYLLDQDYFDTFEGRAFLSSRFSEELGPGREPDAEVEERHADIAASLQRALEETVLHMARHLREQTGLDNLCLTGGVAQNWVLGGRVRADGSFARVHTGFAPGDEGTAVGAALLVHAEQDPGTPIRRGITSDLGPRFSGEEVQRILHRCGLPWDAPADAVADAAERMAAGRIIGWFEGRLEFGPRALGRRSILLDPTNAAAKERLVETVKPRARYHPFGIAVAEADLGSYFEDTRPDPHMASHRRVREEVREVLGPILHADGTARVQTVAPDGTGGLPALLAALGERTGHPVVLNTSLNVPGRPLARDVRDAVETFFTTGLDDIYLEGLRLSKPGGR
jgi:carbamoyltransferase